MQMKDEEGNENQFYADASEYNGRIGRGDAIEKRCGDVRHLR